MSEKQPSKKIDNIRQSTFERSMALFQMTLSGGAKYAGVKWGGLFRDKSKQEDAYTQFLIDQAERVVRELGKLKGSVMKAGQMLSVYGEHFFPPQINQILKNLQSDSEPVSWSQMEKVLLRGMGKEKLAELEIDPEPIGAASMGQVYRGTIKKTGQVVAIKVQYPGVDQAIDSDLKALKMMLNVTSLVPKGPSFDSIFREIRMMLHYETDFRRELNNMLHYRELLQNDSRFVIATPFPEYCSNRILVMSFEEGYSLDSNQVEHISQARKNLLGAAILELMYKEIFEWRQVQTDPHFGNYKVRLDPTHGDQIILFDFGAVRQFPKKYIQPFAELVYYAIRQDTEKVITAGNNLGFLRDTDDQRSLDLFRTICFTAAEGFAEEYASPSLDGSDPGPNPYCWGETSLFEKLSQLGKNAVFTFKLRPPPREAIFMDRKMVGTYFIAAKLQLQMGPRRLMLKYLEPYISEESSPQ